MNNLTDLLNQNPFHILKDWLQKARDHSNIKIAEAMVLSTYHSVSPFCFWKKGTVSSRVILVKEIRNEALIFYTNYNSPKSRAMLNHKQAAINFYWSHIDRQIRLEGTVHKISRQQSVNYWKKRPRESQISQSISKQSETLENYHSLKKRWSDMFQKFDNAQTSSHLMQESIPCPSHW